MIGYISHITKLKNEDIIVRIVSSDHVYNLYRFYGLRHSIINIGRKIDFEIYKNGVFMPNLRNILHIKFDWENDYNRLYHWQQFIHLIDRHLKDIDNISDFYIKTLDKSAIYMNKQSPSRVLLDSYINILDFEGRLVYKSNCCICKSALHSNIVITHDFLPAHEKCLNNSLRTIHSNSFLKFIETKKSLFLNDEDVNYLLQTIFKGL